MKFKKKRFSIENIIIFKIIELYEIFQLSFAKKRKETLKEISLQKFYLWKIFLAIAPFFWLLQLSDFIKMGAFLRREEIEIH